MVNLYPFNSPVEILTSEAGLLVLIRTIRAKKVPVSRGIEIAAQVNFPLHKYQAEGSNPIMTLAATKTEVREIVLIRVRTTLARKTVAG